MAKFLALSDRFNFNDNGAAVLEVADTACGINVSVWEAGCRGVVTSLLR